MLRCLLVARKENLTNVSTGLTGRSKNLDPTSNPTGRSTRPVPVNSTGFDLCCNISSKKAVLPDRYDAEMGPANWLLASAYFSLKQKRHFLSFETFLLFEIHIKVYVIDLLHSRQSARNRASSGIQNPACGH